MNHFYRTLLMVSSLLLSSQFLFAQEWAHYGNDLGGTRFSALKQINRVNVSDLEVAWTFHTGDISKSPYRSAFECTPIVINEVMYIVTPFNRVLALRAETGTLIWEFDPELDRNKRQNLFTSRGVAFWKDGPEERVFMATLDGRLFALEARSGRPAAGFGQSGWIDLRKGVADEFPNRGYGATSPPLVYENLVITGSAVPDSQPQGPSGAIRAFDARTGAQIWSFNTVPQPGEAGHDTWEDRSWMRRGGTNAWAPLSCDLEKGIVYIPLGSPSADRYGGDREGENLFGNSLVALEARSGKLLWHFQLVHHDLWDWDVPAQPTLVTLRRSEKSIPAVVQITKMGLVFVFDRYTGEPLFEVKEQPFPKSHVPGEQSWPTQPIPSKPPPLARQNFSPEELTNVTPESRAECMEILQNAVIGRFFQPPGLEYTILFPGTNGGLNWGGASYDPISNLLFVNSMDAGQVVKMVPARSGSPIPYIPRGISNRRFWDSKQYPCQKPPWGMLHAIDLNTGDILWQKVLGVVDALVEKGLPATGAPNLGGSLVTAGGLVFIAATNDSRFRAFDKQTGEELWLTRLPASGHANPMTFWGPKTQRQFVVIAAGGGNKYNEVFDDALVAFRLP